MERMESDKQGVTNGKKESRIEKGIYRYRDYSANICHMYIAGILEDGYHIRMLPVEFALWMASIGWEDCYPNVEDCTMHNGFESIMTSRFLPYLTKIEAEDVGMEVPDYLCAFPLTESDKPHIGWIFFNLYYFEKDMLRQKETVTDIFRNNMNRCIGLLPMAIASRLISHAFHRYSDNSNRLALLTKTGIAPYLVSEPDKSKNV